MDKEIKAIINYLKMILLICLFQGAMTSWIGWLRRETHDKGLGTLN